MTVNTLFDELRAACPTISVGMLTADWMCLSAQLALIEQAGVKLVHIDVMDGSFCPLMTFGPPVIKATKTALIKDVHLMIDEPLPKLASFVAAGADMLTVHVESCRHIHRALQALGTMTNANHPARGIVRGLALNPGTPLEVIPPLIDEVEMILLLAVNPGWSGQAFIPATAARVAELIRIVNRSGRDILIAVDGGVKKDNLADIVGLGADIVVTGSAVFDGKAPRENAQQMLAAVKDAVATA